MRPDRLGVLAIVASAIGYGFISVLIKLALEAGVRPLPLVAWRFAIASLAVWLLLGLRRRPLPSRSSLPRLLWLGGLYSMDALLFTLALQWVTASTATLVFYAYPVVVVLLAAAFLGEGLGKRRLVATGLATLGCALTAGGALRGGSVLGIVLVVLSMAALSVYIVTGRRILDREPAHGSAAVITTACAAILFAVAIVAGDVELGGGARGLALISLLAIVSTAIPITLFVVGLQRVEAGRAAIYSTLEPVVTVLTAAVVLDERIGLVQILGGLFILSGVLGLRSERPLPESEWLTPLDSP
ncbi:MAG: DMT family transporter [Gemmatimonadota bacterium]